MFFKTNESMINYRSNALLQWLIIEIKPKTELTTFCQAHVNAFSWKLNSFVANYISK